MSKAIHDNKQIIICDFAKLDLTRIQNIKREDVTHVYVLSDDKHREICDTYIDQECCINLVISNSYWLRFRIKEFLELSDTIKQKWEILKPILEEKDA